ncbi:MAG: phospholipid carrier-dependent glycosyltransferase [Solirubrobacterales bacterium]|nr:phospholipid carrier-dependent glycosyltransferase [Solirubrobacterales bacterium]
MVRRPRLRSLSPLVALAVLSVLSLAARGLLLDEPCQSPCTTASEHTLIFDEAYYVNAARVIAGIRPPAGSHYDRSPLRTDPNAEHPQGAKLIMAAAIEIFGDGPFAWRIGSLLFGSLAILGMYALVRAAGGGPWSAFGAAALMACDNLLLVHGRIATLDIYAVAPMVWGVAAYLSGRPGLAGVLLAVADCFKEVAPYALFVLGLLELGRVLVAWRDRRQPTDWGWRPALRRLVVAVAVSIVGFVGLLGIMGLIARPYADAEGRLITGGPIDHLRHMITYAEALVAPHGATGIASYPWQWLVDYKPIVYVRINSSLPGQGLGAIHPVSAFIGMVSPPILALGLAGVLFALFRLTLAPRLAAGVATRSAPQLQLAILGAAWFIGTWAPYQFQSAVDHRISYLYYMVVVMPGLYVAAVSLASLGWRTGRRWLRWLIAVWSVTVLVAVVLMYPFVAAF